jgi:hypothetical protein
MAHFAKIENGYVTQVDAVADAAILDENGVEQEALGIALMKSIYGEDTDWVQTSYNNNFRGVFAGINFIWDGTNFVLPVKEKAIDR